MADGDGGFNCCGDGQPDGEQACECIKQDLEHRVIPCGSRKMAGQERTYRTTTSLWLSRTDFMLWSKKEGLQVDPICWFTEMRHGPIPPDVKP